MAYEVIARKWRPQQFGEVVGQEHVTRTLRNAIKAQRIAHAYLFVGPRGIGKTSLARIFAKALNCIKGPTETPCGKCESCVQISEGRDLDVIEIDAASNNGVEQIRELRETVKYATARSRYKIYIIDEVHMLSSQAFNALLKTLEEPPAHVKFIFATTEPDKILPTIISRCQRFDLRRIPVGLIVGRLKEIAISEKITIDDAALNAIARGSDGGLRDAESALDQLIAFCGDTIKEDDVLAVFGIASSETLRRIVTAILQGNIPDLIGIVNEIDSAGKDYQKLIVDLLRIFRDILVFQSLNGKVGNIELASGSDEWLKEVALDADPERIFRVVSILMESEEKMRFALSRRTLFEVAMIRCARSIITVTIDEILKKIQDIKTRLDNGEKTEQLQVPPYSGGKNISGVAEKSVKEPSTALPVDKLMLLQQTWNVIIDKIAKISLPTRQGLADSKPISVEGDLVRIALDPEFKEEMSVLTQPRHKKAIEHVISTIIGTPARVEFFVGDAEVVSNNSTKKNEDVAVPKEQEKGSASGKKSPREWANDKDVKRVIDIFGGDIVDIR